MGTAKISAPSGAGYPTDALAAELATVGVPSFACSPDQVPDLMAAAINRQDLHVWAAKHDISLVRGADPHVEDYGRIAETSADW